MNFDPSVRAGFDLPERVFVLDSTLRKMTETPGCRWTPEGGVEIARAADEAGVQMMVVNVVHRWQPPSREILKLLEAVATLRPRRFKLFGTAWLTKESIDWVLDRGADGVDLTRGDMDAYEDLYDYARSRGALVAKTMALGGRIEHVPPTEMAAQISRVGRRDLAYVGIHENKGPTAPETWRYYVRQVRRGLPREVALVPHIHNMLGQATAAMCAAVTGGASGVDVSMNGIATDCGLAALEEVVVSLELLYGVGTGIRLDRLRHYSQVVSRVTGIPVHHNKSLVGDQAFLMEADAYVHDVLEARLHGREYVHLLAPSLVGHAYTVVWGPNTVDETGATREKLLSMGLPHDEETARSVNERVRRALGAKTDGPQYLTEAEVEEIAQAVASRGTGGAPPGGVVKR
jgi:D-citramalate synthase